MANPNKQERALANCFARGTDLARKLSTAEYLANKNQIMQGHLNDIKQILDEAEECTDGYTNYEDALKAFRKAEIDLDAQQYKEVSYDLDHILGLLANL
jgi:hypothetical protein